MRNNEFYSIWDSNVNGNIYHSNFRLNKSMKFPNSKTKDYQKNMNDSLPCLVLKVSQSMNWKLNFSNIANGMHKIY